jgi:recombinational DNA repair ATPase RecF
MSASQTILVVSVAVAAISIAILMLDDVFAELDRRRREDEMFAAARRHLRQRHS